MSEGRNTANCDAVDLAAAAAAVEALEAKNANLILPHVPGEAEAELILAFEGALTLRPKGGKARNKADREFVETAVRLHRAGEKTEPVGSKPSGIDVVRATAAAEEALGSATLRPLLTLLIDESGRGVVQRHQRALATQVAKTEPETKPDVPRHAPANEGWTGFHQVRRGTLSRRQGRATRRVMGGRLRGHDQLV